MWVLRQSFNIYLRFIPRSQDGAWHIHGLTMGIPIDHLTEFKQNQKLPREIKNKLKKGMKIYDWDKYAKAFGHIAVVKIQNAESISKYITKYITEDLAKTRIGLNDHMYYCSTGLERAETMHTGQLTKEIEPDFENEYVKIKTISTLEEAMKYFQ